MLPDANGRVNHVANAISPRGLLRESSIETTVVGPNSIVLPLERDSKKLAFTLENVLRLEECDRLVAAAEDIGFNIAGLGSTGSQVVATQFRDSCRLIVDDRALAQQIFHRIQPHLPTVWDGRRIIGLNEQLKFLRYRPGQKFVAHFDGSFCRPSTKNRTCLTVQLYLSRDDVEGGATRFMDATGCNPVKCLPLAGRALIFQHNILHDGEEVRKGMKYTIRTDVEYSERTFLACLQELFGLGCSPIEQKRRCLNSLPVILLICATMFSRCPRQ